MREIELLTLTKTAIKLSMLKGKRKFWQEKSNPSTIRKQGYQVKF